MGPGLEPGQSDSRAMPLATVLCSLPVAGLSCFYSAFLFLCWLTGRMVGCSHDRAAEGHRFGKERCVWPISSYLMAAGKSWVSFLEEETWLKKQGGSGKFQNRHGRHGSMKQSGPWSDHGGCLPSGPDGRGTSQGQRSSQSNTRTGRLQFQKTKRTQIFSNDRKLPC